MQLIVVIRCGANANASQKKKSLPTAADIWWTRSSMMLKVTFRSPRRFNLAPEAEGFVHIKFALSCQGGEDILLQPDDLRSVPAVGRLLSARHRSSA